MILLQTIDHLWKEHLLRMDHLKEGINLRAYAQKDPLIEYKKEAFLAFEEMDYSVKAQSVEKFLKIQVVPEAHPNGINGRETVEDEEEVKKEAVSIEALAPKKPRQMTFTHNPGGNPFGGPPKKVAEPARNTERVGRNDPCPCGSGKKYKKCHGATASDQPSE